jgi:hypothetical protein
MADDVLLSLDQAAAKSPTYLHDDLLPYICVS